MELLSLQEIEKHEETEQMVRAITAETEQVEWVSLFSANGKHGLSVRRDPATQENAR
ncbi:hypothetical protein [Elongatibacter sediminis]|uniref:Uncharacterized protein n=1 Tax=Elongatibacter sediminis TaxID=3119006 RepID=A0AAW9RCM8_9GAMM